MASLWAVYGLVLLEVCWEGVETFNIIKRKTLCVAAIPSSGDPVHNVS